MTTRLTAARVFLMAALLLAVLVPQAVPARAENPGSAQTHAPVGVPRQLRALARIEIPAIGVSSPVFRGVTSRQFARGVGHWPGTPAPGRPGNSVLAAHRTSAPAPFADLDRLRPGDRIHVSVASRRFTYRVTRVFTVRPSATWVTHHLPGTNLTLVSCHPKGSTSRRIIVQARLVEPQSR